MSFQLKEGFRKHYSQMKVMSSEECNTYELKVARSAMAPETIVVAVAAKAHWNSHCEYPWAEKSPDPVPNVPSPFNANESVPTKPPASLPNASPYPRSHHVSDPMDESPMF